MMELRQLRYLLATVEAGTVSGAAERLHITQPGLSRQLRQLEKDLGVELFDRANQRLTFNRTGHELLPLVRDVLAATQALRESAGFHAEGGIRRLTIAAPTVTLTDIVSPFVATMSPDDPVVDVRPADGLAPTQMLANGADLAIGTRRPQAPYGSRDLPALPMWAYVRRDDPWRERSRVSVEELLGRTVVGVPTSFTAREALEAAVSTIGGSFTEFIEAANGTIAQALAAAGRGVAVVSDDPRYELVPIAIDLHDATLTIQLVAAWDIRKVSAPAMAALAGRLADWVAERAPRDDGEDDPGVTCTWKAPNTTE
jgi:DNA-binding transcriptional LysR family regulator